MCLLSVRSSPKNLWQGQGLKWSWQGRKKRGEWLISPGFFLSVGPSLQKVGSYTCRGIIWPLVGPGEARGQWHASRPCLTVRSRAARQGSAQRAWRLPRPHGEGRAARAGQAQRGHGGRPRPHSEGAEQQDCRASAEGMEGSPGLTVRRQSSKGGRASAEGMEAAQASQ